MRPSLVAAISKCFQTQEYADLIINCGAMSWKAHKVIVCSQSKVLKAACRGFFKETTTGIIELPDDDPKIVQLMLSFFYTTDYEMDFKEAPGRILQMHVQTFTLADKYDVPALMSLAKQNYEELLMTASFQDYLGSIPDVYVLPRCGNSLRKPVIKFARERMKPEFQKENIRKEVAMILEEVPEFGFDVLEIFLDAPLRGDCRDCGPNQGATALQASCHRCRKGCISRLY